jgi:NADPH-dependent 2,4-dienoyl-CoA reductase/sulfur reductase-like enzyme/rhodanese-related sulfurtransferase
MRLVIVGGVAGGMSAATRARRVNEAAEIVVLEKGGFVSFANCGLPYYLAGRITPESKLLVTDAKKLRERFNIDARTGHEVLRIDRMKKEVEVRDHVGEKSYTIGYDKLILATGASAIVPPDPNAKADGVFVLRSMEDTRAIHTYLATRRPESIAIIGAGFIGLEMAEAMVDRGLQVQVIERNPQVLPPIDPELGIVVRQTLEKHGVSVHTGAGLKSIRAKDGRVRGVELDDGREISADMVLLSIGVRPNLGLAQAAGLVVGPSGGLLVDEIGRTSDPDVYAVGDMIELKHGVTGRATRIPLAGPANRMGRRAGEHAVSGVGAASGRVMGTAVLGVFETTAALTGLSETAARTAGIACETAYVSPNHHAGYYPGAEGMRIKLIYDPSSRKLLGAQAVGGQGVDKRIDVVATVLHFGGTIDDLASIDLCYAPQFGSAKDAIHMAAFVAQNQADGLSPSVGPGELPADAMLVDVRSPDEFARGSLKGAVNLPVDGLRDSMAQLPKDRSIVVYCQVGQRGYVAQRILRQRGFERVFNLKGGYSLAKQFGL